MVLKAGHSPFDELEMISELRTRLAKFKVPKRIMVVPELPRNAMGKVQKSLLRQTYEGLYAP